MILSDVSNRMMYDMLYDICKWNKFVDFMTTFVTNRKINIKDVCILFENTKRYYITDMSNYANLSEFLDCKIPFMYMSFGMIIDAINELPDFISLQVKASTSDCAYYPSSTFYRSNDYDSYVTTSLIINKLNINIKQQCTGFAISKEDFEYYNDFGNYDTYHKLYISIKNTVLNTIFSEILNKLYPNESDDIYNSVIMKPNGVLLCGINKAVMEVFASTKISTANYIICNANNIHKLESDFSQYLVKEPIEIDNKNDFRLIHKYGKFNNCDLYVCYDDRFKNKIITGYQDPKNINTGNIIYAPFIISAFKHNQITNIVDEVYTYKWIGIIYNGFISKLQLNSDNI